MIQRSKVLKFQSHANLLRLSSLKGLVQDSAFSAYRFLMHTSQIRYIQIHHYLWSLMLQFVYDTSNCTLSASVEYI